MRIKYKLEIVFDTGGVFHDVIDIGDFVGEDVAGNGTDGKIFVKAVLCAGTQTVTQTVFGVSFFILIFVVDINVRNTGGAQQSKSLVTTERQITIQV